MRIYSYLFQAALAVAMLAMSAVAWLSGQTLNIWILPWQGETLTRVLFAAGLVGLVVTAMAVRRILPALFVLWSAAVLVMLVRGFFFGSYVFGPTSTGIMTALWFVLGAFLAAVGSVFTIRRGERAMRGRPAMA
jgi:hypothetical protein